MPEDVRRSRVASSILVAIYAVAGFTLGGTELMTRLVMQALIPWACVCFPEAFGNAVGPALGVTRRSPRSFVWFFGWLVLLLPILQVAIALISGRTLFR